MKTLTSYIPTIDCGELLLYMPLLYKFLYAIAFNIDCEDGDENNLSHEVLDLSWEGAMRLRKLLPDDVDLFCHSWDPYRPNVRLGYS